jgi:hypothetical protein
LLLFLIKGCLEICYLWRHCVQTVNQLKVFHIYSRDLMLLFLNLCLKNLPHPMMTSWDDFMYLLLSKSTNTINTKSKLLTLCLKCTDLWIIFGQILHAQPQSQTFSGERETQHSTEHNALHNMTSLYSPCLPSWIEIKAINKALEEITCYASIITSGVGPPYRGRACHRVGGPAPPLKMLLPVFKSLFITLGKAGHYTLDLGLRPWFAGCNALLPGHYPTLSVDQGFSRLCIIYQPSKFWSSESNRLRGHPPCTCVTYANMEFQ